MAKASNDNPLLHLLGSLVAERQRIGRWSDLMYGARVFLAATLLIIVVDAVSPLPAILRGILGVMILIPPLQALWRVLRRRLDRDRAMRAEAQRLDGLQEETRNLFINGLWFAKSEAEKNQFTESLRDRVIQQAMTQSEQVDVQKTIDPAPFNRQGFALAALVGMWVILMILHHPLLIGGLGRIFMPWDDSPPYGLTQFDVTVTPNPFPEGKDVQVVATVSGVFPNTARIIERDGARRSWEMSPIGFGGFSKTLWQMQSPMEIRIESSTGASRWIKLRPRNAGDNVMPDYSDSGGPESAQNAARPIDRRPPDQLVMRLYESLDNLKRQAQNVHISGANSDKVDKLASDREAVLGLADDAMESMMQSASSDSPTTRNLVESLKQMRLRQATRPSDKSQEPKWPKSLAEAASDDMQALKAAGDSMLEQESGSASATGDVQRQQLAIPQISGIATHDQTPITDTIKPTDAASLHHAPAAYRDLTARYFKRLAEDQSNESR